MKLRKVDLKGFKSIDNEPGQSIVLGDVTVLLGANGSGKSNFVSFFKMLNFMMTGALQNFVGKYGVERLLHYGSMNTESIVFELLFESGEAEGVYGAILSRGVQDRLFYAMEEVTFRRFANDAPQHYFLQAGSAESGLAQDGRTTSRVVHRLISGVRVYQFHDTSDTAKIKDRGYVDDVGYLRANGGNLAAYLRMLKEHEQYRRHYDRIVRHIKKVLPQFGDFVLDVLPGNDKYVRLNWTDSSGNDYLFGPDQLSDGSLRFMALTVLLLQPKELLPRVIVLDEPELGLHPFALSELHGMIRTASAHCQVLIATQSTRLVDEFAPEEIVVAERDESRGCSVFRRLDPDSLADWLRRYSLSELWEKNVLGGRP